MSVCGYAYNISRRRAHTMIWQKMQDAKYLGSVGAMETGNLGESDEGAIWKNEYYCNNFLLQCHALAVV